MKKEFSELTTNQMAHLNRAEIIYYAEREGTSEDSIKDEVVRCRRIIGKLK